MRKLIISSVIIFLALSCNTGRHISAASIGLKNLDDYTAKQNIDLPYAFNYIVLTNQADFDAAFGIAKAGNINITYPDFKGQTVLACVAQPTASDINIHFDKAEVAGKDLNVYCSVTDNRKTLAQTTTPAVLATVPKVLDIKRIIDKNGQF